MADIKLMGNDDATYANSLDINWLHIQRFQAISSGLLNIIKIKAAASTNVKVGIYSDNAGEPDVLLSSGAAVVAIGWNDISVNNVTILKDAYYWLGFDFDTTGGIFRQPTTGKTIRYKSYAYSLDLPNPAGTGYGASTSRNFPIAGWGTEAAAGCPRQAMHMRQLM